MTIPSDTQRQTRARILAFMLVSAVLLAAVAGTADAASRSKCRNNPENYSMYHGKCLSDKRIEQLKERAGVDDNGIDANNGSELGDDNGNDGPEIGDDNGNNGVELGDDNGNDGVEVGDDNGAL